MTPGGMANPTDAATPVHTTHRQHLDAEDASADCCVYSHPHDAISDYVRHLRRVQCVSNVW